MRPPKRLLATACALSGSTGFVVRRTGAGAFLPDVLVTRFAGLAGVAPATFAAHLAAARSFADTAWAGHWERIAEEYVTTADHALAALAAASGLPSATVGRLLDAGDERAVGDFTRLVGSALHLITDRGPVPSRDRVENYARGRGEAARQAATAVDATVTAMAYYLVAAWPMPTPARVRAYGISRGLATAVVAAAAPAAGLDFSTVDIDVRGTTVRAFTCFPSGKSGCPTILATNGLDGTAQELLLPLLKYRDLGLGFAVVEMPGSYAYDEPMSADSDHLYAGALDALCADSRVDAERIGMFGLSFGGYWAARTTAVDRRVRAAVCAGTPAHRSFGPAGSFGDPGIMIDAMRRTVGARDLREIGTKLAALSLRPFYPGITVPLLVVDGDADTVSDARDSTELADSVPGATLRLYPGDDHCAVGHYTEWMDAAIPWLVEALDREAPRPG